MAVGFRKSLFGFNSQDVIEYIDRNHREFSKKEEILNSKIEELKNLLDASKEEQRKLEEEKRELDIKLNSFTEKYEDIERLSENIGKLYLVAQSNAQAIMRNAEEEAASAKEEVNRNLISIDEAHEALALLRSDIIKTSEDFSAKVQTLVESLSNTREKIAESVDDTISHKENFEKVYKSIVE